MGALSVAFTTTDFESFVRLLRVWGHPLRNLIWLVWGLRQTRWNHPRSELESELQRAHPASWVTQILRAAFGLYCTARRVAAPRLQQPVVDLSLEAQGAMSAGACGGCCASRTPLG